MNFGGAIDYGSSSCLQQMMALGVVESDEENPRTCEEAISADAQNLSCAATVTASFALQQAK